MEAPTPIYDKDDSSLESFLINFNLEHKNGPIEFKIYEINNSKIKLTAYPKNSEELNKYELELSLIDLQ